MVTVAPKKPKTSNPEKIDVGEGSPFIGFKTARDIEEEFNEFSESDNYFVILYNDEYNKRAYVQKTLMEVFSWDESKAFAIMMQVYRFCKLITQNNHIIV